MFSRQQSLGQGLGPSAVGLHSPALQTEWGEPVVIIGNLKEC